MYITDPEDEQDEPEEFLLEEEAPDDEGDDVNDEAEETVILLEGEQAEEVEEETPAIKRMRERIKELNRENRQLRGTPAAAPKIELGPEPTMEDDDVDWDADKFKTKLAKWIADKAKVEREQEDAQVQARKANEAWEAELAAYERKKAALAVQGKEEAEEEALSKLSQIKQAIIVKHPNNAAIMIALGKYPKKLTAVAAIEDPVLFAYAIADIGRELKVTARRKAPEPEGIVRGSAALSATSVDKKLEALEKEALRTRDRTKIIAYKAALRA